VHAAILPCCDDGPMPARRALRSHRPLAAVLAVAGVLHFARPTPFARTIPPRLPGAYPLVYASGAAELACAVGLVVPRTRRAAGWATAALLVVVFPANVQMAYDARRTPGWYRAAMYLRLPVQVPLVAWALRIARQG
jgi:uncharacterized membrane protein